MQNIAIKRYFLIMNKKDVLGASAAAGNVQKMKSAPHGLSAGNAHFPALIPSTLLGIFWYRFNS